MAAYNRSAATFFTELAERQADGEFYSAMASLVFSAFTLEAFFNTLGEKLNLTSDEYKRASPDGKMRALSNNLEFTIDRKRRPYSSLSPLFRFRNAVAHGQIEKQRVNKAIDPQWTALQAVKSIESEVMRYCCKANAKKAYEDTRLVASDLCNRAGFPVFPGFPFGLHASGIYKTSSKKSLQLEKMGAIP